MKHKFELTGEYMRGQVAGYHRSPRPLFINKSKKGTISGLKAVVKRNTIIEVTSDDIESKFTIGMEVEKTRLSSRAIEEYALLKGFERDSSCGFEAITHVLPLLPACRWRQDLFSIMYDAEKIIDDQWSPSDTRCGGHITVGAKGFDGEELMVACRQFSGILMAIFKPRLRNNYCRGNKRMRTIEDNVDGNYIQSKYNMVNRNSEYTIEFRLCSRFTSVLQMMNRYKLMYELVNTSINHPRRSFNKFLENITPIIMSMYDGDEARVTQKLDEARMFNNFLRHGRVHEDIRRWV
tara:strand:+ start:1128 stop:2006 length:879 start_codon:yes stop_codon:yes gene_type:complete